MGLRARKDFVITSNEHGAGMIDAWLAGQCINHRPGGFNLNCYAAQSRPVLKEHVGGYLPDWYYDESRTGEMPQHMIDEMDVNVDKYNRLGCERGGDAFRKQAFAPMGWPDACKVMSSTDRPWSRHRAAWFHRSVQRALPSRP